MTPCVLDVDGGLLLQASPRFKDLISQIPGMNWHAASNCWRAPLSWATALACRGVLKDHLSLTNRAAVWAGEERLRCQFMEDVRGGVASPAVTGRGLYPYQEVGATFLLAAGSAGLFDEPGVGKTPQACVALSVVQALPALVVCPNSMAIQWQRELKKWAGLSASIASGTKGQREKIILSGADVVIINWEALRSHSRLAPFGSIALTDAEKTPGALNTVSWQCVIADESHRGKDARAKQTRALWAVSANATYRWALTGTPLDGKAEDLWAVMRFVSPCEWPSKSRWIDRYALAGQNAWGGMETYGFNPSTEPEMQAFLRPRMIRRTKTEVLPSLPAKVYSTRWVAMDSKQERAYRSMQKEMLADLESGLLVSGDELAAWGRLSQIAQGMPVLNAEGAVTALEMPSCKVSALLDLVSEYGDVPLVVGAESRKLIDLCSIQLAKYKITHTQIVGGMTQVERQFAVDSFQQGAVQVMLVSLGAGAEGITLTRASTIVRLHASYRSVVNNQFEDRIHRVGQSSSSVQVIDVVTEGTVDIDRMEASHSKEEVGQQVLKDAAWLRKSLIGSQGES